MSSHRGLLTYFFSASWSLTFAARNENNLDSNTNFWGRKFLIYQLERVEANFAVLLSDMGVGSNFHKDQHSNIFHVMKRQSMDIHSEVK